MLCPSCRSTLFAGAFECRFCGKKIPQPPSARIPGLALGGIVLAIIALVIWGALFRSPAEQEQVRLRQAASCGYTTPEKLGAAARQMAAKSNIALTEAMHRVEFGACPNLAN